MPLNQIEGITKINSVPLKEPKDLYIGDFA